MAPTEPHPSTNNTSILSPTLAPLKPAFPSPTPKPNDPTTLETPAIQSLITSLSLTPHIEGGYFVETDRDPQRVPNPFTTDASNSSSPSSTRAASTSIHYLLTPASPLGHFHSNRARTVHTLHKGRGRYVLIHPPWTQADGRTRVETFLVGQDVAAGEKLQWVVEGGVWKATFLLPDEAGIEGSGSGEGLLISETVVPGFEYEDHDFLSEGGMRELVGEDGVGELGWLVRRD
ncbi:hypothetical protein MBLNU230_g0718t1 [Neophaeotheca triangularis]